MDAAWTNSPEDVFQHFQVDPNTGLSSAQAAKHQSVYGKNGNSLTISFSSGICASFANFPYVELPEDPPTPLWELILEQFKDQLVLILLASALISFVLALLDESDAATAFVEPLVILLILIANATVGVIQETSAEKAIDVCYITPSCRF